MDPTRRRFLTTAAAAAGIGSFAGCLDDTGDGAATAPDGASARATFFVFGDVTAAVAGDAASADLLVPVGQHGHGWEPGPSVREEIRDADLLVHGMEGFQPWVDDVTVDLDADEADVNTVDVTTGVDLLPAAEGGHDHGSEDDHHDGHEADHDEEGDPEAGHDEDHDEHDGDDHQDGEHDGHDHEAGTDPHFWMDPLRLKDAVDAVREGLAAVDPDGADAFDDNAAQYRSRLDDLHERLDSAVAEGSTDVLLIAGHDSYQYFGERYGVEVEALTNVSPDDRPTTRDIERAQEVIETHDLRYVCADPLESQQAAEQLVAETDAEEVLPLTAMPGLTEEWEAQDWGYVEVVENVNLPTLERALEAR